MSYEPIKESNIYRSRKIQINYNKEVYKNLVKVETFIVEFDPYTGTKRIIHNGIKIGEEKGTIFPFADGIIFVPGESDNDNFPVEVYFYNNHYFIISLEQLHELLIENIDESRDFAKFITEGVDKMDIFQILFILNSILNLQSFIHLIINHKYDKGWLSIDIDGSKEKGYIKYEIIETPKSLEYSSPYKKSFMDEDISEFMKSHEIDKSVIFIRNIHIPWYNRKEGYGTKLINKLVEQYPDSVIITDVTPGVDSEQVSDWDKASKFLEGNITFFEKNNFVDINDLTGYEYSRVMIYKNEVGTNIANIINTKTTE